MPEIRLAEAVERHNGRHEAAVFIPLGVPGRDWMQRAAPERIAQRPSRATWEVVTAGTSGATIELPSPVKSEGAGNVYGSTVREFEEYAFRIPARTFHGTFAYFRYRADLERKIEAKAGNAKLPELYRSVKEARRVAVNGREWFVSDKFERRRGQDLYLGTYFTREGHFSFMLTFGCFAKDKEELKGTFERILNGFKGPDETPETGTSKPEPPR